MQLARERYGDAQNQGDERVAVEAAVIRVGSLFQVQIPQLEPQAPDDQIIAEDNPGDGAQQAGGPGS